MRLATAVFAALVPVLALAPQGSFILGQNPDQIIARYGVPNEVRAGPAHLVLGYRDRNGSLFEVAFHEGVAVYASGDRLQPRERTWPPRDGVYLGISAIELVRRVGAPRGYRVGEASLSLELEGGVRIDLAHGRVVGVRGR